MPYRPINRRPIQLILKDPQIGLKQWHRRTRSLWLLRARSIVALPLIAMAYAMGTALAQPTSQPAFSFADSPVPSKKSLILRAHDAGATLELADQEATIRQITRAAIQTYFSQASETLDWRRLISPTDRLGIKVHSQPGPLVGVSPAVVAGLVDTLLEDGIKGSQITVWDRHLHDLHKAGFQALAQEKGIRLAGAFQTGYAESITYENEIVGQLVWGDFEYDSTKEKSSRISHLTRLVAEEFDKIINVAPLLNHNSAGVSGLLWSLAMGSIDNSRRFQNVRSRMEIAVPEIYGTPELADRVILNLYDALICQYRGQKESLLHYSVPLNEVWVGQDAVAMDALALRVLKEERMKAGSTVKPHPLELLENAELLELGKAAPEAADIIQYPDSSE